MRFSNRLMAAALGRDPQTPTAPPSAEDLYGDRDLTDIALRELALDIAVKIPGARADLANARDLATWLLDPEANRVVRRSALERAHHRLPNSSAKELIRRAEEFEGFLGEREEWSARA